MDKFSGLDNQTLLDSCKNMKKIYLHEISVQSKDGEILLDSAFFDWLDAPRNDTFYFATCTFSTELKPPNTGTFLGNWQLHNQASAVKIHHGTLATGLVSTNASCFFLPFVKNPLRFHGCGEKNSLGVATTLEFTKCNTIAVPRRERARCGRA